MKELSKKRKSLLENYIFDNNLTKMVLVKKLKMSTETYWRFENGESVSMDTAKKFSKLLNVKIDDLI